MFTERSVAIYLVKKHNSSRLEVSLTKSANQMFFPKGIDRRWDVCHEIWHNSQVINFCSPISQFKIISKASIGLLLFVISAKPSL